MPKSRSKTRHRRPPSPEARARTARSRRLRRLGVWAAVAVLVGGGGGLWWRSQVAESAFLALAQAGRAAPARVETPANRGGGHTQPGETARYADRFPTSGRHDPRWVVPGFYDQPQPAPKLVHSLEHGNVVVYYDRPGQSVLATLGSWADLYGFEWGGVIAVPAPGLGPAVVLTAWRKRLRLDPFDASAAAAFVDDYRGRGPEKPIR